MVTPTKHGKQAMSGRCTMCPYVCFPVPRHAAAQLLGPLDTSPGPRDLACMQQSCPPRLHMRPQRRPAHLRREEPEQGDAAAQVQQHGHRLGARAQEGQQQEGLAPARVAQPPHHRALRAHAGVVSASSRTGMSAVKWQGRHIAHYVAWERRANCWLCRAGSFLHSASPSQFNARWKGTCCRWQPLQRSRQTNAY